MSSARLTVTDWGVQAMSVARPSTSIPVTVVVWPEGSTVTGSPTRSTPEASWPA